MMSSSGTEEGSSRPSINVWLLCITKILNPNEIKQVERLIPDDQLRRCRDYPSVEERTRAIFAEIYPLALAQKELQGSSDYRLNQYHKNIIYKSTSSDDALAISTASSGSFVGMAWARDHHLRIERLGFAILEISPKSSHYAEKALNFHLTPLERGELKFLRADPAEFFKRILQLMVIKRAIQKALSQYNQTDARTVEFSDIECNLTKQTVNIVGQPSPGWLINLFSAEAVTAGEVYKYQCCSVIWHSGNTRVEFRSYRTAGVVFHRYASTSSTSITSDSLLSALTSPMEMSRAFVCHGLTGTEQHGIGTAFLSPSQTSLSEHASNKALSDVSSTQSHTGVSGNGSSMLGRRLLHGLQADGQLADDPNCPINDIELAGCLPNLDVEPKDLTVEVTIEENIIGKGAYSVIKLGTLDNEKVAIKILNKKGIKKKTLHRRIRKEVAIMAKLNHPNLVPLYGVTKGDSESDLEGLVLPLYDFGSAKTYLANHKPNGSERLQMFLDVASGLRYLHSYESPIAHGDLNPNNILIDNHRRARICDFGLSRIIGPSNDPSLETSSPHTGTLRYTAPENLFSDDYDYDESEDKPYRPTTESDVHSLGCVGMEFVTGLIPYHKLLDRQIYHAVIRGKPPAERPNDAGDHFSRRLWDLFESCWKKDPTGRPKVEQALSCLKDLQEPQLPSLPVRSSSPGLHRSSASGAIVDRPCRPSSPLNPHRPQSPALPVGRHIGDSIYRPSSPLNPLRIPRPQSPSAPFTYPSIESRSGDRFRRSSSRLRPQSPTPMNNVEGRNNNTFYYTNPLSALAPSHSHLPISSSDAIQSAKPVGVESGSRLEVQEDGEPSVGATLHTPAEIVQSPSRPSIRPNVQQAGALDSTLPLPGTPIAQDPLLVWRRRLAVRRDGIVTPVGTRPLDISTIRNGHDVHGVDNGNSGIQPAPEIRCLQTPQPRPQSATGSAVSHRSTRRTAKELWEKKKNPRW